MEKAGLRLKFGKKRDLGKDIEKDLSLRQKNAQEMMMFVQEARKADSETRFTDEKFEFFLKAAVTTDENKSFALLNSPKTLDEFVATEKYEESRRRLGFAEGFHLEDAPHHPRVGQDVRFGADPVLQADMEQMVNGGNSEVK